MNPPHMVFHIVDTTKHLPTALPLAKDTRIVLRLMSSTVLLAAKPILPRLGTSLIATEEVLAVTVEVLPQITASVKDSLRGTARVGAAPVAVARWDTVVA